MPKKPIVDTEEFDLAIAELRQAMGTMYRVSRLIVGQSDAPLLRQAHFLTVVHEMHKSVNEQLRVVEKAIPTNINRQI